MLKEVKVVGLNELQEKLDFDVLVQPEMEDARDTIVKRMLRGGKGLGAQRNSLTAQVEGLSARVTSTLVPPRTTGRRWGQYQEKVVKGIVARNAVNKAVKKIEERWASGQGAG